MRIKEALLVLIGMAVFALVLTVWRFGGTGASASARPIVFQLSWRAQVESGGFVQAVAKGFYRDCGLDVELRQGGAGVDPAQLLVGGAVDAVLIPQSDGIMHMNKAGFPARAVFASMQHTPASIIVHDASPVRSVADMRGKPIMISASSRAGWWPFLRMRYGFTDDQIRPFSGGRTPFIADPTAIAQDVISNGPYVIWQQSKRKVRSFLLTDLGYDPYGGVLTVSQALIDKKPDVVRCLVQGSQRGWADFMRDPKDGFAEILRMSPEMNQGLIDYGFKVMKERHIAETPDTTRLGMGAMTAQRWRDHAALLVASGVLPKGFDPSHSFDTQFLSAPTP